MSGPVTPAARVKQSEVVRLRRAAAIEQNPAATLIQRRRVQLGLTQRALAHCSKLSPLAISRIEKGQSGGTRRSRKLIARALETTVGELWP